MKFDNANDIVHSRPRVGNTAGSADLAAPVHVGIDTGVELVCDIRPMGAGCVGSRTGAAAERGTPTAVGRASQVGSTKRVALVASERGSAAVASAAEGRASIAVGINARV